MLDPWRRIGGRCPGADASTAAGEEEAEEAAEVEAKDGSVSCDIQQGRCDLNTDNRKCILRGVYLL
jgi:hypothetical protein